MNLEDHMMDLLIEWEDRQRSGQPISVRELAGGDSKLEQELEDLVQRVSQTDWVHRTPQPVPNGLDLPSKKVLTQALILPDNLTLEGFLENLKKAELCEAEEIKQLIQQRQITNASQLVNTLIDTEMLTRFQVRAVAHGKTKGLTLGNYQILDKIGEGGMGVVYQARHSRMDRIVALKVLARRSSNNKTVIARFLREAKTAARLSHPNIVETYDSDETHGYQYLVMEYIEGQDLSQKIRRSGVLNVSEAVDYLIQVAQGLEYAHNEGIIHRDIKPSNLVLDTEGCVKILDMGLARVEDPDARESELTQTGSVMGTVDYMPPEQAIDTKTADRRADLYSLGCTLHFLLTGQPPFEGETILVKMLGHREQTPPDLTQARQDVHPQLNRIFQKLMAKLPAARYQTAGELIAALESIQDEIGSYEESIGTVSPKTPGTESEFDTSVSFDSETRAGKVPSLDLAPDERSWLNFNVAQVPLNFKILLIVSLVLNLVFGTMFIAGMLNTANKNNLIPPPDVADINAVTFGKVQVGALDASVTVNMQDAAGKLDAWIDFNGDRSWGGPGEKVFSEVDVSIGDNVLQFDVPSWAIAGTTNSRFRLSTVGDTVVNEETKEFLVEIMETEQVEPDSISYESGESEVRSEEEEDFIPTFGFDSTQNSIGMNPPGELQMGSPLTEKDRGEDIKLVISDRELSITKANLNTLPWPKSISVAPVSPMQPIQPPSIQNMSGMNLVKIPAGEFKMGSPLTERGHGDDEQQHLINISQSFYLATTEVTQAQWIKTMNTRPWKGKKNVVDFKSSEYPATYISLEEAKVYCERLSDTEGRTYRLPTEEEWEYACRAGTTTAYSFGDDDSLLSRYAWFAENSLAKGIKHPHQVKLKLPNPWGLYDMHGNVWEFCSNGYRRGGSWFRSNEFWTVNSCRSASRVNTSINYETGFRVVCEFGQATP